MQKADLKQFIIMINWKLISNLDFIKNSFRLSGATPFLAATAAAKVNVKFYWILNILIIIIIILKYLLSSNIQ